MADRVSHQVERADEIIGRVSRFAHTCDVPRCCVDLHELATLLVGLTGRLAEMRGVRLESESRTAPLRIDTDPFALLHMLFIPLMRGLEATPEGATIRLTIDAQADAARVALRAPAGTFDGRSIEEIGDLEKIVASRSRISADGGELTILVPRRSGG